MSSTSRFDTEASSWDSNPTVQTASRLALASLLQNLPQLSDNFSALSVLEIGCGTGILSFLISPYINSLCAVDASEGMINAFKQKLARDENRKVKNLQPVHVMLEDPDDERIAVAGEKAGRRFDLVISHLVLHHIPDLAAVLKTMFGCLKTGGSIALTDFEDVGPQSRRFHPEAKMEGVERHGVKRSEMERLMGEAGFVGIRVETAFEMEKDVEVVPGKGLGKDNTEQMSFPFLICIGIKP